MSSYICKTFLILVHVCVSTLPLANYDASKLACGVQSGLSPLLHITLHCIMMPEACSLLRLRAESCDGTMHCLLLGQASLVSHIVTNATVAHISGQGNIYM